MSDMENDPTRPKVGDTFSKGNDTFSIMDVKWAGIADVTMEAARLKANQRPVLTDPGKYNFCFSREHATRRDGLWLVWANIVRLQGDKRYAVKKPCGECPFSRNASAGTLGGSDPLVYVGQANGPFWLPCHMHTNYDDPNWKRDTSKPQCAGAAIFRANVGVAAKMPGELHCLPSDNGETVFLSFQEFLAHHAKISKEEAEKILSDKTPDRLTLEQVSRRSTWIRPAGE